MAVRARTLVYNGSAQVNIHPQALTFQNHQLSTLVQVSDKPYFGMETTNVHFPPMVPVQVPGQVPIVKSFQPQKVFLAAPGRNNLFTDLELRTDCVQGWKKSCHQVKFFEKTTGV